MRLGDIYPRDDVTLVLHGKEYKIEPPSLATLAKIEQWFETATGQKKRWHEIFGDTTGLTTQNFAEFMHIMIEVSNDEIPKIETLMRVITTANFGKCIEAVARAVKNASPEPKAGASVSTGVPAAWETILRHALEVGISWEDAKEMTVRELHAVLVKQKEEEAMPTFSIGAPDPGEPVSDKYNPNWMKELREKNVVPTDWRREFKAQPPERQLSVNEIANEIAQSRLSGAVAVA
jgi:hypothetical protein